MVIRSVFIDGGVLRSRNDGTIIATIKEVVSIRSIGRSQEWIANKYSVDNESISRFMRCNGIHLGNKYGRPREIDTLKSQLSSTQVELSTLKDRTTLNDRALLEIRRQVQENLGRGV